MNRAIVFSALTAMTACGGGNNGPMTYQRPPIEQAAFKSPHPERGDHEYEMWKEERL